MTRSASRRCPPLFPLLAVLGIHALSSAQPSVPYHYDANHSYCIVDESTGQFNGYVCVTTDGGISFTKAEKDEAGLCINPTIVVPTAIVAATQTPVPVPFKVPSTACGANNNQWLSGNTQCQFGKGQFITYGTCTTDKQYICRCDDAGKYPYPVLINDPRECTP